MGEINLSKPEMSQASDMALRELLMRRAGEIQSDNQRFEALAESMRSDAQVFASTMIEIGAASDVAAHMRKVRERGLFSYPDYTRDEYPVWFIPTKEKYGGGSLDCKGLLGYDTITKRLVVRRSGELALVSWHRSYEADPFISPEPETLGASEFINREAAETEEEVQSVRAQWTQHLEEAAERYTRKPFVHFDIRKM